MTSTRRDLDVAVEACAHVLDIELSRPAAGLRREMPDGVRASRAWALARLFGEPLGWQILDIPPAGLSPHEVESLVLEPRLAHLTALTGMAAGAGLGEVREAVRAAGGTAFSRAHAGFIARAPRCSVVICTRGRPDGLRRCLSSLTGQDHPNFAVWVVDNQPGDGTTRPVVDSFRAGLDIRYVAEPRPGLSRARNTGLRSALEGEIVAWLDDDEVADSLWLSELARAFDGRTDVVAASGAVVPAELVTLAQLWFEQFGGHSKGRGFTPAEFSSRTRDRQDPLYPLPPFGVGANMAFRTKALLRCGGFDEALGAGAPAQGAEDTKIFTDLLRAGGTVAYRPSAVTRHYHRRDLDGLRRQLHGYGSGLTAFYTALALTGPATTAQLVRLAPRALHDLYAPGSLRVATLGDDFPRELLAHNRRGLRAGPWLYLRGRMRNRWPGRPGAAG